nr:hypothetical protein [Streptomyces hygroscopicus]
MAVAPRQDLAADRVREEDEFEARADPVRRTIPRFEQLVDVVGLVDARAPLVSASGVMPGNPAAGNRAARGYWAGEQRHG